ncbi:hypothetical protein ABZY09_42285 [Streptomyces sp. NPDC002928]|uniref:hypothetical protein n=1 Tax=Streptomyces sp. NPDC002928 TaxID=3154440 RepID=UPI0033B47E92
MMTVSRPVTGWRPFDGLKDTHATQAVIGHEHRQERTELRSRPWPPATTQQGHPAPTLLPSAARAAAVLP